MKRILTPFLFFLTVLCASAQRENTPLPRYLTDFERKQFEEADKVPPLTGAITQPPNLPVRAMAEWEELQAVLISWSTNSANYQTLLAEIVRAAREECRVVVCCSNQTILNAAKSYLTGKGVNLSTNVEFVIVPNDSIWVRDYGPNCVYANGVDSLYFVDWIYNRSRKRDDTLATGISKYFGTPLYATTKKPYDLVNTGGNVMTDGLGTAFSSELVLDENGDANTWGQSNHSESDVNDIMKAFMGIDRYLKVPTLPYDGIHHLDMHMKLLDEQTLLVGQYPAGRSDGPQIEANIQYVLGQLSALGDAYKIVRIPMPPYFGDQYPPFPDNKYLYPTYANSVFVNKTILMPKYEQGLDKTAQQIYEKALPGYKVVPLDCRQIVYDGGAIHCITKEIGVADPLLIVHKPLEQVVQGPLWPSGYSVEALMRHRSGIASAKIWYTTDSSAAVWQSANMTRVSNPDSLHYWRGTIPRFEIGDLAGKSIYYYLEANAQSGKKQVRPMPAPKGWWKFHPMPDISDATEVQTAALLDIYPNPAAAITCIPVSVSRRTKGSLRVFNALGTTMQTVFNGDFPAGASNYFIDASTYISGVYFVALQAGGKMALKKIVVR